MTLEQVVDQLTIETRGEGFTDITEQLANWVREKSLKCGVLHLNSMHTSCSLLINENADPNVLLDLSSYMKAIVPEEGLKPIDGKGDTFFYRHKQEGKDDMPAHIRTALTCSSLSLSIKNSAINLGTWQAIYLWEHRKSNYFRKVNLHAIGELLN